jgi:hypothetical protein
MTPEQVITEKKEFERLLQSNYYEFKNIQAQDKEAYFIYLNDWLKNSLLNHTKNGSLSFTFRSKYELTESFIDSIGPVSIKYLGEITVESPVSVGRNILIGYNYNCNIKPLIFL